MDSAPASKPGPSLAVALAVVGVGVVLGVAAFVVVGVRVFKTIDATAFNIPGTTTRHLGAGTWVIYQHTGTGFSRAGAPDLDPSQVVVSGPGAVDVPVSYVDVADRITKNLQSYTAALQFDAPSAGTYTLAFTPSGPSSVIIAPSLSDAVGSLGLPVGLGGTGAVLVVIGVVLVVVGVSRRSRARVAQQPAAVAGGPPPGWYPDPYVPGGQRWWDGSRWM